MLADGHILEMVVLGDAALRGRRVLRARHGLPPYWAASGTPPPPAKRTYLDAGRVLMYAVFALAAAVVEAARGQWIWAALLLVLAVVIGRLALVQARRNAI